MRVIFTQDEPDPNNEFVERCRRMSNRELVEAYNREIGNPGCVSARGRYLHALYCEMRKRRIDLSEVNEEPRTLQLDTPVRYEPLKRKVRIKRRGKEFLWERMKQLVLSLVGACEK